MFDTIYIYIVISIVAPIGFLAHGRGPRSGGLGARTGPTGAVLESRAEAQAVRRATWSRARNYADAGAACVVCVWHHIFFHRRVSDTI